MGGQGRSKGRSLFYEFMGEIFAFALIEETRIFSYFDLQCQMFVFV